MKRNGSVLIIFIWVLLLFSLFAMSVAIRTRLATKIEGYQMASSSAGIQAMTAINLARFFIDSDENRDVDSVFDPWYGEPKEFAAMEFSKQFELQIADEDGKININSVQEKALTAFFELLKKRGYEFKTEPKKLAGSILAWRGTYSMGGRPSGGFKNKNAPFESLEELHLIQEVQPEDVDAITPFLTVYARPDRMMKLNINTVQPLILEALIASLVGDDSMKQNLFDRIQAFRDGELETGSVVTGPDRYFTREDLRDAQFLSRLGFDPQVSAKDWRMRQLVRQLLVFLKSNSEYYSVTVTPKLERGGGIRVQAVLGQRHIPRMSPKPGALRLARPRTPVTVPLEILSWRETRL